MRIKKSIEKLHNRYDEENPHLSKRFYNYLNKIKQTHRVIIKYKNNNYICGNCNYEFKPKINYKVNSYHKCPNCKGVYLVKTSKLRKYTFRDNIALLTRFEDKFIIRAFEVKTWLNNGCYDSHVCEYARQTYDENLICISEAYNNNISASIGGKYVNHQTFMDNNWKENGSYYYSLGDVYKLYTFNLKKELKNTKWQYCQIEKYAKKIEYFDVIDFLRGSSNKTELLIKSGLYKLVYDYFKRRHWGELPELDHIFLKNNLIYIKKHKLNCGELAVFQYIKSEDIKLIRKYGEHDLNYERLKEYNIDLKIADTNIPGLSKSLYEYDDYLRFAKELKYNLKDKKILYPSNLKEAHDKALKQLEIVRNKKFDNAISKRYKKLIKNKFNNKKYIIFPAKNVEALVDESSQQNNCVRTYAARVAKGECDIYFMRYLESENKSLVTVEVRNNKVVQKRTKNNFETTKEQDRFLSKWEKEVLSV